MKALIDGDVVCYSCGFASEETVYEVYEVAEDAEETEQVHLASFKTKKEVDDFAKDYHPDKLLIEVVKKIPPLSHSLHNCRMLIENILERTQSSDYSIYLTGDNNFRHEVATIKGYKAHRDKDLKPAHYKEIRDYLINVWKADVVHGMEADDAMAIAQMEAYDALDEYTVICTIDKDLDQVPGWHFNWRKDDLYIVSRVDAIRYYAKQMLTGDATDNIMGVPGIGPKKAEKILSDVPIENLPNVLMETYENKFTPEFIKTLGIPETVTWKDIYNEMDKLIRIKWYIDD